MGCPVTVPTVALHLGANTSGFCCCCCGRFQDNVYILPNVFSKDSAQDLLRVPNCVSYCKHWGGNKTCPAVYSNCMSPYFCVSASLLREAFRLSAAEGLKFQFSSLWGFFSQNFSLTGASLFKFIVVTVKERIYFKAHKIIAEILLV